jgi:tetratricopeptide (TPR) repeat protein
MKAKTILDGLLLVSLFYAIAIPARAQTGSSQQTLNQYVADLQSNPNDTALRGKIIALMLTMDPLPEVPAEARRHMARGVAAVEDAKTSNDFRDACNEFQQAATLAPWLANAYRNLAIAQDKAGLYDEALASLRLYLLTKPSPTDAGWAEDLKSKVEYRKEKAARPKYESNAQPVVPQENSFEALLRKIDGRRYSWDYAQPRGGVDRRYINVKGNVFIMGILSWGRSDDNGDYPQKQLEITGRETTERWTSKDFPQWSGYAVYTISDDGERITKSYHYQSGATKQEVFNRER